MPLFSEHINNMYYSGMPSYSAPYSYSSSVSPLGSSYSASYLNPGGNYSSHSSLGSYSRAPLSTRWTTSSGRNYSPILSTISERGTASPVRISSPRRVHVPQRVYATSNYSPRPININTADIDVSRDKYRHKVESPPPAPAQRTSPSPDKENGPFMPRVDGKPETGIDSSPGLQRSTIKRGRTVVRLHTVKRKERDSPRKPQVGDIALPQETGAVEVDEKAVDGNLVQDEPTEPLRWREKLSEDLTYKDKREKKTLGAKLVEKFIVKDKDDDVVKIRDRDSSKKPDEAQSLPVIPLPNSNASLNRSPDRRCSVEMLAEQANLLDSLIRGENLSTAPLDLSKVGISDEAKSNTELFQFVKRRKSNELDNRLQTTKSDHSLHESLKSFKDYKDPKHFSKRRSLKKSSSGGSICRLDSITEFPREIINSDLPAIEESRLSIKRNSVKSKPKSKLKTKITSSVEVSEAPKSPLKFRVDVTVEEKPHKPKKEFTYSAVVDELPKQCDSATKNENESNDLQKAKVRYSSKRKTKLLPLEDDGLASPEPDDGNFWDKIGKRETVYLMRRKQFLEEDKEKHRRALYWFPEEEEIRDNTEIGTNQTETVHITCQDDLSKPSEITKKDDLLDVIDKSADSAIVGSKLDLLQSKADNDGDDNKINKGQLSILEADLVTSIPKINKETINIPPDIKEEKETINRTTVELGNISKEKEHRNIETNDVTTVYKNKLLEVEERQKSLEPIDKDTGVADTRLNENKENLETFEVQLKEKAITISSSNPSTLHQSSDNKNNSISDNNLSIEQQIIESTKPNKNDDVNTFKPEHINNKTSSDNVTNDIKLPANTKEKDETAATTKINNDIKDDKRISEKPNDNSKKISLPLKKSSTDKNNIVSKSTEKVNKDKKVISKQSPDVTFKGSDKTEKLISTPSAITCPIHGKKADEINYAHTDENNKVNKDGKNINETEKIVKKEHDPITNNKESNKIDGLPTVSNNSEINVTPTINSLSESTVVTTDTEETLPKEDSKENFKQLTNPSNSEPQKLSEDQITSSMGKTSDIIREEFYSDAHTIPIVIESENIPNKDQSEIRKTELIVVEACKTGEDQKAENLSKNEVEQEVTKQPSPKSEIKLPPSPRRPVKDEPALRPLIATPRPLQKKVPQVIHSSSSSESSSEEDSSDDEDADESDTSEDSTEFFECENNPDGRTSTGSNDSGFDSSAPTSPAGFVQIKKGVESPGTSSGSAPATTDATDILEQELEQSTAYGIFRKTGRFTPPARSIPRFRKYTIEDFHFIKVLGKGSFGKVLLAELRDTEYYYAVKCLKKDVVLEDDDVECTLIERKVLALGTNHPYLCHLFATFQTDSHLFFVMEYLNGGDLMFHIQQSGRFPEARARFYAAEIVSGLKFLHKRGIVYRDLKLDNILLDFDGHVRIADFGMCKLQIYLEKTADTFCGTPDYMAPEIIKGLKYNQTVDWWSFGVLMYEMLIGQSPFSGCDEDELFWSICNEMPSYPRFLSQEALTILTRLLDKDARTRLGSTECMHGDVREQAFFHTIHWDRLERRELEAPFKPRVRHPMDTQYFDRVFTGERPRLTAVEPNVLRSMDQEPFRGFSYTNPNATDR